MQRDAAVAEVERLLARLAEELAYLRVLAPGADVARASDARFHSTVAAAVGGLAAGLRDVLDQSAVTRGRGT